MTIEIIVQGEKKRGQSADWATISYFVAVSRELLQFPVKYFEEISKNNPNLKKPSPRTINRSVSMN